MPPRKPPSLAELLTRLRLEAGLSLYELSHRSGINRSNLHRMEKGVITDPSRETLNRIAGALGTDPEQLYEAILAADPAALPELPTYFRAKYRLNDDEIAEVERLIASTGKKPRAPAKQNSKPTTKERRSP